VEERPGELSRLAELGGPVSLTPKQQRFVEEYLVDLNATEAALRAGYSSKRRSAKQQGFENLKRPAIAAAIQEARAKLSQQTGVSAERVLEELARIAFSDIRDLFTWDEERACYVPSRNLTKAQAAIVSSVKSKTRHFTTEDETETSIELELKTYDKLGALEKLGKHLGMFVEKHEHSGPSGGPVEVRVTHRIVDAGDH
jgi:phage terminase small subunit